MFIKVVICKMCFIASLPVVNAPLPEVEITGGHWSNATHFITMTDHQCKWSVGMTDHS